MISSRQEIPANITPDQYDKLMRKIWELEQRMAAYDKIIILHDNLDQLFHKQARMETQISEWKKASSNLLAVLAKLIEK